MSGDDPFDRLQRGAKVGKGANVVRLTGELVAPVPPDAPPRLETHKAHGRPATTWAYRGPSGELLGFVCRFNGADGSKVVLPLTLRREAGRLRWAWKGFDEPRPLYGLDRLAARPGAPVLVVEGEKTADAAAERFPAFAVVTWPGGSKAASKVDWSPLFGREVSIWPDADAPGAKAAADVAKLARAAGATSVAAIEAPSFLPDGWDLADAWPDGFDQGRAAAVLEAARTTARPGGVEWPYGFRMDGDGLWYDQPGRDGGKPVPTWIAAPFEVVGEARDPEGGGWSVVVKFSDRDRREKVVPVSRGRLAGGGAEVRAELADAGLIVSPARGKADKFVQALAMVECTRRSTLVAATGWCGERFVLPSDVIGPPGAEAVIFTGEPASLHYRRSGSLDAWRANVAALADGNDLLTFALSLAFLGPLMRPLDLEGGGVHFRGSSSCGKTTLAYAAGSVWGGGGPLGFGQTWRSTANALEMVAYGHNDGLVVFDELALVAPEEAGAAAYSLASGQSKARSKADGSLRRRPEWRVAILSTGEISLADHIRASRKGDRAMAGQELRLLDLAADAGAQMGVWKALNGFDGPAAMSDAIKAACGRDYGLAGPAFLEAFAMRRADALPQAKGLLAAFLQTVAAEGDTGQAQRAAVRFGAIAVAGELAALFGVLPWPPGQASDAAKRLYHRWAAGFGRDRTREAGEILRRLRGVIESERSAFSPLGEDDTTEAAQPSAGGRDGEARSLRTYGFRRVRGPDVDYLFNSEGWKTVFTGFDSAEAARVVDDAGYLERDDNGKRLQKKVSVRGEKQWLYCVRGSILALDLGD